MTPHTLEAYLKRGFVLVPIPAGTKGPRHPGWNRRENCITRVDDLGRITGNVGLAHAYSGTCALDVDDFIGARDWLSEQNIDLDSLLAADDAVQIVSGRPNRAKLLYRLETPLSTIQIKGSDGCILFELRCATADGLSTQDVLPPSLHPETGWAYRWKTNGAADGLPDLPQSLLALWKSRLEQPRPSGGADGAIHEGGRNDLLFRLAASLRAKGLSVEAIEVALLAENRVRCSPPLPEHEIRTIARSAGRYEPGRDQRSTDDAPNDALPPPLSTLAFSEAELASARLTPTCIVRDYLYTDVAALVAPGGTGKTTLLVYEAIQIALRRSVWGLPVMTSGRTLIVTAEDPRNVYAGRQREIMAAIELTDAERAIVNSSICVWDVTGMDRRLCSVRDGNIVLTSLADQIIEAYKDDPPILIVFDPLVSFGATESAVNDNEQALVTAARRIVRELGCCVRYVHHTGKANARDRTLDQYCSAPRFSQGMRLIAGQQLK
jgi:hypothetical protein